MKTKNCIPILALGIIAFGSCKPQPQQDQATATTTTTTTNNLPALSPADNKAIIAREISTWEFGKTRNFAGLREILANDYVGVFGKNILGPNDVVRTFEKSRVNMYRLSNIRVKPVTADVAIIYYNLMQDILDENGSPWIPNVASTAVYVKRNNRWYNTYYTEIPLEQ